MTIEDTRPPLLAGDKNPNAATTISLVYVQYILMLYGVYGIYKAYDSIYKVDI